MKYYTFNNEQGRYVGGMFAYGYTVEKHEFGTCYTFQLSMESKYITATLWDIKVMRED